MKLLFYRIYDILKKERRRKMKKLFRNFTNSYICISVLAILLGFILILDPTMSMQTIGILIACYVILQGIILIAIDINSRHFLIPYDGIISGVISIVVGIILLGKPKLLSTIMTIIIGVWFAISSINMMKMSLALKEGKTNWLWLLILSMIDLTISILMIFNPFETAISITVFVGIMIIVHALINIVDMFILKKNVKNIEKVLKNRIKISE